MKTQYTHYSISGFADDGNIMARINGKRRTIVAVVRDGEQSIEEFQAIKEFIVRACNAHEELLEALQAMIDAFNVKEIDPLVAFASIEKAKAAIQKAQGD